MQIVYVMTHEYSDHSGFSICGITEDIASALAWYRASDETNVYELNRESEIRHWMDGVTGWKQKDQNKKAPDAH